MPAGSRPRRRRASRERRPLHPGISVSFGGVHAGVEVSLDVEAGKLVGLIGPDGTGKTTFIDAILGGR